MIHLPCIGIFLKPNQLESPNIKIFCNNCLAETSDGLNVTHTDANVSTSVAKMTPNKTERTSIKAILNEMNSLRELLITKLDTIDGKTDTITENTKSIASKLDKPSIAPLITFSPRGPPKSLNPSEVTKASTPKSTRLYRHPNVSTPKPPSYANVARLSESVSQSAKRRRLDEKLAAKYLQNAPKTFAQPAKKPKKTGPPAASGTKKNFAGLSVVQKPQRAEKPSFEKAVWVSRFQNDMTTEGIIDYIATNIETKDRFNVHKLVKKDRDVSTLKFISFKIQVSERDFDVVMDPDVWPEEVMIREFHQSQTLGDFFPPLPSNTSKTDVNMTTNETFSPLKSQTNDKSPKIPSPPARNSPTKSPNQPNNPAPKNQTEPMIQ